MRVIIRDTGSDDVRMAVFYKPHKFIPAEGVTIPGGDITELLADCTSTDIQYKGSSDSLLMNEFTKYDYLINPEEVHGGLKIEELDGSWRNLIGTELEALEAIESTIFPTLSNSPTDDPKLGHYFVSSRIGDSTVSVLKAFGKLGRVEGHYKIELYDNIVTSNNSAYGGFIEADLLDRIGVHKTAEPKITIIFGPTSDVKNNLDSMYYSYDPMKNGRLNNDLLGIKEYKALLDELSYDKLANLVISSSTGATVNLSYRAWANSKEPNRVTKDVVLRNDAFFKSIGNISGSRCKDIWSTGRSSMIVGTRSILPSNSPVLSKKLSRRDETKYSRFKRYNLGDEVVWSGRYWTSTVQGNYNNVPGISVEWELTGNIKSTFTSKVSVLPNPIAGGTISPGGIIAVPSGSKRFELWPGKGYKLNTTTPCSYEYGQHLTNDEYTVSTQQLPTGEERVFLTIHKWTKPEVSGSLLVNFINLGGTLFIFATDKSGNRNAPSEFLSTFGSGVTIEAVTVDGIKMTGGIDEITTSIGKLVEVDLKLTDEYIITKAEDINQATGQIIKELPLSYTSPNLVKVSGEIEETTTQRLLHISPRQFEITTLFDQADFEVSEQVGHVDYNSNYLLNFVGKLSKLSVSSSSSSITISSDKLDTNYYLGAMTLRLTKAGEIWGLSVVGINKDLIIDLIL